MEQDQVQFYRYAQEKALAVFLPILHPHLPISNGVYNRIKAPVNLPSRHCLFAATFPPDQNPNPNAYTILFADRSRHEESQIWMFNSMNMISGPLSQDQRELMSAHVRASVLFLKHISIPEAPGWPFQPDLKYSCVHEKIAVELLAIGVANDALSRHTIWNLWVVDTSSVTTSISKPLEPLPEGYSICRVPANQIDTVISTSSVLRQASTYLQLPSMAILDAKGILVAWGYIGPDGTLATLFVQPDFRGKGFAKIITVELLDRLYAGDFIDMGFDGSTGWAHSNVYDGNVESEAVMMAIGGKKICTTSYIWIDSDRF